MRLAPRQIAPSYTIYVTFPFTLPGRYLETFKITHIMNKFFSKGETLLAYVAALLMAVLAIASAFRSDGGAALLCFCFAYIAYDLGRGFQKEEEA